MSMNEGRARYEKFMKTQKSKGLTHKESLEAWKLTKDTLPGPKKRSTKPTSKKTTRKPKTSAFGSFYPARYKRSNK